MKIAVLGLCLGIICLSGTTAMADSCSRRFSFCLQNCKIKYGNTNGDDGGCARGCGRRVSECMVSGCFVLNKYGQNQTVCGYNKN
jgi:hypothetical protein